MSRGGGQKCFWLITRSEQSLIGQNGVGLAMDWHGRATGGDGLATIERWMGDGRMTMGGGCHRVVGLGIPVKWSKLVVLYIIMNKFQTLS